jgi:hypothetical protein
MREEVKKENADILTEKDVATLVNSFHEKSGRMNY